MSKETRVITIFVSFLMLVTFSIVTFGQGKSGAFPTGAANPMPQLGDLPTGATPTPTPSATPIPILFTPYDFNHDNNPDFVLYNGSTRQTAVGYMHNNVFGGGAYGRVLPAGWSLIDVADFNGDGNNDYALFNPSTRHTAIWYLSGTMLTGSARGPNLPVGWTLVAILTPTRIPITSFSMPPRAKQRFGS